MNDKTIKKNITKLWNQAYINYDDCYAHGLKSEGEKKEWLRFLRKVIGKQTCSICGGSWHYKPSVRPDPGVLR